MRNNSNVPPKDYRGTMNTKQAQLRIWGSSSDDCPTTWSTSGLTCRIPLGQNPGLEDLAKFFKRQAAIKNYRGFAGVVTMPTTKTRAKKKKPPNRTKVPSDPRQISSFATDFSAKDSGRRPGTGDGQCKPLLGVQSCLCCSGSHKLGTCLEFQNKDLQIRWDIVKYHRLCHVCIRPGHHRDRCESQKFCPCRSDKRHHKKRHLRQRPRLTCKCFLSEERASPSAFLFTLVLRSNATMIYTFLCIDDAKFPKLTSD